MPAASSRHGFRLSAGEPSGDVFLHVTLGIARFIEFQTWATKNDGASLDAEGILSTLLLFDPIILLIRRFRPCPGRRGRRPPAERHSAALGEVTREQRHRTV